VLATLSMRGVILPGITPLVLGRLSRPLGLTPFACSPRGRMAPSEQGAGSLDKGDRADYSFWVLWPVGLALDRPKRRKG